MSEGEYLDRWYTITCWHDGFGKKRATGGKQAGRPSTHPCTKVNVLSIVPVLLPVSAASSFTWTLGSSLLALKESSVGGGGGGGAGGAGGRGPGGAGPGQ